MKCSAPGGRGKEAKMAQDFLSQQEVDALLRGVTGPEISEDDWAEAMSAQADAERIGDDASIVSKLRNAPVAVSVEADFDALTWTFRITPDCRVGAGKYALVWMGPNA